MATDNGNVTGLALLDLSAAFDTVNRTILLRRLFVSHDIAGRALDWFSRYVYSTGHNVSGTVVSQVHLFPCNTEYRKALSADRSYTLFMLLTCLLQLLSLAYSFSVTQMTLSFISILLQITLSPPMIVLKKVLMPSVSGCPATDKKRRS